MGGEDLWDPPASINGGGGDFWDPPPTVNGVSRGGGAINGGDLGVFVSPPPSINWGGGFLGPPPFY